MKYLMPPCLSAHVSDASMNRYVYFLNKLRFIQGYLFNIRSVWLDKLIVGVEFFEEFNFSVI